MRGLTLVLTTVLLASAVHADNWPGWRGPNSDGVVPAGKYPTSWSDTDNVVWKVKLGGRGASTPTVWGDQVFITLGQDGRNQLLCVGRDGKLQWNAEVGEDKGGKNGKASGSNPSCVTDGDFVFAYFKSGDLAAFDLKGKQLWQKNVQEMYGNNTLWWDLGTSPVLTQDHVVITVMQTGPSFLAAFDKATGELAWKQDRDLGAPLEAAQSYTTPVVANVGGEERIYVVGADHVTAHSAETGKELWRVGGLNPTQHKYFRSISSPTLIDGLLIAPYARGGSVTAVRLGGQGDVTESHVAWTTTKAGADVPTPTGKDGRIYFCRDGGEVVSLDAKSGEVLHRVALEKNRAKYSSSPVLVGDNLYVTREDGKTFVLDTTDELEVVGANDIGGEQTVASPIFVDGQILLRTYDHLYCIGKPQN